MDLRHIQYTSIYMQSQCKESVNRSVLATCNSDIAIYPSAYEGLNTKDNSVGYSIIEQTCTIVIPGLELGNFRDIQGLCYRNRN